MTTIITNIRELGAISRSCISKDLIVRKEFHDWYVQDHFFAKKGVLIVNGFWSEHLPENHPDNKLFLVFDFSNPDNPTFSINYSDQLDICKFSILREENLPFNPKAFKFRIDSFSMLFYFRHKRFFISRAQEQKAFRIWRNKSAIKEMVYKPTFHAQNKAICGFCIAFIYTTMFHVTEDRPVEFSRPSESDKSDIERVDGIYKYNGFVNTEKPKIYRMHGLGEQISSRDYNRHIQSWVVRGHYRTTKTGKRVWVESHVKGQGTIEERTYGFNRKTGHGIVPKIFNVKTWRRSEKKLLQKFDKYFKNSSPDQIKSDAEKAAPKKRINIFTWLWNKLF